MHAFADNKLREGHHSPQGHNANTMAQSRDNIKQAHPSTDLMLVAPHTHRSNMEAPAASGAEYLKHGQFKLRYVKHGLDLTDLV